MDSDSSLWSLCVDDGWIVGATRLVLVGLGCYLVDVVWIMGVC